MRLIHTFLALSWLAILASSVPSCVVGGEVALFNCENPNLGHFDHLGNLDPCCLDDTTPCSSSPSSSKCDGDCMATNPDGNWEEAPVLFWRGDYDQAPTTCPDPTEYYKALYADPSGLQECPECVCGKPSCILPPVVTASDAAGCNGPTFTDFPVSSDGFCSTGDIKPNALKSLALPSATVSPCTPSIVPVVDPKNVLSVTWKTKGIVCTGTANGACTKRGDVCVPHKNPGSAPSGFMQCIRNLTRGDEATPCPEGSVYSHKYIMYENVDYNVACAPCTCGAPVGANCTALVSVYQDKSCATPIFENYVVPYGGPVCTGIGPNLPLQGVTAKWDKDQPGECAPSGGVPTGKIDVDHTTAHAFCCTE